MLGLLGIAWQMQRAFVGETEVRVESLREGPVSLVLALNGRIEPGVSVTITAAVSAYVAEVTAQEGDVVQAGDRLLRLDAGLVQAQLAQAEAALRVQTAKRDQAAAAAKRADTLGGGAISRSDREGAETALATAEGEVERLSFALQEVTRQLERYDLRAPMHGIVLSRDVEVGQLVGNQDALLVLAQADRPIVKADVDELYAGRILLGQSVLLRPVGMSQNFNGQVSFIAPRIDPATGGRAVEIRFEHPPNGLPFGLTVNTNIIVEEHDQGLSLPRSALTEAGSVFTVVGGVLVEKRPDYVAWPADRLMIRAGLEAGDLLVLDPTGLQAGDKVKPVQ